MSCISIVFFTLYFIVSLHRGLKCILHPRVSLSCYSLILNDLPKQPLQLVELSVLPFNFSVSDQLLLTKWEALLTATKTSAERPPDTATASQSSPVTTSHPAADTTTATAP